MNRLSARIKAYQKIYETRASQKSLQKFEKQHINLISAVILVLFNDIIEK